jgi:hypothetical protein
MRCLGATIAFVVCVAVGCMTTEDEPTWQRPGLSGGTANQSVFNVLTQYDPDSFEYRTKPKDGAVTKPADSAAADGD